MFPALALTLQGESSASIIACAAWIVIFKITRYVSLASMLGAAIFPLVYIAIGLALSWPIAHQQSPLLVFSVLIPAMIVYKHRANIARLRAGTENRFAKKA